MTNKSKVSPRERYNEDARHSAACAIAVVSRKLPSNHRIVQLISEGRNSEALQLLDWMDHIDDNLIYED